jgi:hypothetical protein
MNRSSAADGWPSPAIASIACTARFVFGQDGDLLERQAESLERDDPFELHQLAWGVAAITGVRTSKRQETAPFVEV